MDKETARKTLTEMFQAMGLSDITIFDNEGLDDSVFSFSFDNIALLDYLEIDNNSLSRKPIFGWIAYTISNHYSHDSGWDSDIHDLVKTPLLQTAVLAIVNVIMLERLDRYNDIKQAEDEESLERELEMSGYGG